MVGGWPRPQALPTVIIKQAEVGGLAWWAGLWGEFGFLPYPKNSLGSILPEVLVPVVHRGSGLSPAALYTHCGCDPVVGPPLLMIFIVFSPLLSRH